MNELKEIRENALVGVRDIAKDNKDRIREAYEWVMRLDRIARSEGLLALEYEVGVIPKDMPLCKEICTMVRFVTDGTEPKFLAELMTLKFIGEGYQGLEALLYFLYARGMLLIQAGESPWVVEAIFSAVIPSDILTFDWQYSIWQDEKRQKVENIKKLLSEKEKGSLRNIAGQMAELTEAEWNNLIVAKKFHEFDKIIPYLDADTQMLVKEHVNESRYYTIMQFPEILREDEICLIEAEFEAMLIAIRSKAEPTGLLFDVIQRSDEEMQEQIQVILHSYASVQKKRDWLSCLLEQVSDEEKQQVSNMIELIDTCLRQIYQTEENVIYIAELRHTPMDRKKWDDEDIKCSSPDSAELTFHDEMIKMTEYLSDIYALKPNENNHEIYIYQLIKTPRKKHRIKMEFSMTWMDKKLEIFQMYPDKEWLERKGIPEEIIDDFEDVGMGYRELPFKNGDRLKIKTPLMTEYIHGVLTHAEYDDCGCWYYFFTPDGGESDIDEEKYVRDMIDLYVKDVRNGRGKNI